MAKTNVFKAGSIQLTQADLQAAAGDNADGVEVYTGAGDTAIDFGRGNSFLDEGDSPREIIQTFRNTSANDVVLAICPGYFSSAANVLGEGNVPADFIIADGTLTKGADATLKTLVVTSSPKTVVDFLGFIKQVPTRVLGFKIKVDDAVQLEEPLYYRDNNPFGGLAEDRVNPSSMKDDSLSDEKAAIISNLGWQFDGTHIVVYKVRTGRTVTITWKCGAAMNPSLELDAKYRKAKKYVAVATVKNM